MKKGYIGAFFVHRFTKSNIAGKTMVCFWCTSIFYFVCNFLCFFMERKINDMLLYLKPVNTLMCIFAYTFVSHNWRSLCNICRCSWRSFCLLLLHIFDNFSSYDGAYRDYRWKLSTPWRPQEMGRYREMGLLAFGCARTVWCRSSTTSVMMAASSSARDGVIFVDSEELKVHKAVLFSFKTTTREYLQIEVVMNMLTEEPKM